MMKRVFPDVVVTEEDLIAGEDKVVERSSAVATHRASMMNEPPNEQANSLDRDPYLQDP